MLLKHKYLENVFHFRYIITGNNLGETKIVFNAGSGDMLISSEPINVQVSWYIFCYKNYS